MSGIAGEINKNINCILNNQTVHKNMQSALKRRGPDQDGFYIKDNAALIHTRLINGDTENGRQPMIFNCGGEEYVLVCDGRLYNAAELHRELELRGHKFAGGANASDAEIIGHAYIEWREASVEKFNGVFAFALWESKSKKLFIARDRIGVKPFFYTVTNGMDGGFVFSSEIKGLLAHPSVKSDIDANSIAEIMLIGPGRTPGYGIFKEIKELKPGSYAVYNLDNPHNLYQCCYWDLIDARHTDTFNQTLEKVRYLVTDSIERQLISDRPVCTFLSGGLDSSLITSVASEHYKKKGIKLYSFSVDYKDNDKYFNTSKFQPDADKQYIEHMKKYMAVNSVGSADNPDCFEHRQIILDTDMLVDALYMAVDARDLPGMADVDSSLLCFCGEVKKYASVALSGESADEIFGGYPWYRDKEIRDRYGFPWSQSTGFRKSFLKDEFINKINAENYVSEKYLKTVNGSDIFYTSDKNEKRVKQMVNLNMKWFMQTLLDRTDRMSMYNGLEVRVPYCDYRIAEYLYTVPWEYKDYNGVEKGLLRMAMRDLLPDKVLWRKKNPYPKTHNPEYLSRVSSMLKNLINEPSSPILDILKKDVLENMINNINNINNKEKYIAETAKTPWYGQLMTIPQIIAYFLQINYWLKKYKINFV